MDNVKLLLENGFDINTQIKSVLLRIFLVILFFMLILKEIMILQCIWYPKAPI